MANFIEKRTWIVFVFFLVLIFFLFGDLLNSYFEADEWFHFTYYLPLTKKPDGFLTALLSTFTNSGPLSGGQHVIPVASAIYFLNTKFFGMDYAPYAFMSLFLHAVNSFLVFLLVKTFLNKKDILTKNTYAILSSVFFALSPQPTHAITGASPFYGQNVLSVTFFLLCILTFKLGFIHNRKKFIYYAAVFLFLALFSKETTVFLFLLLPFMAILEKKAGPPAGEVGRLVFPPRFLSKVFILSITLYAVFRFVIPNMYALTVSTTEENNVVDTGTIVSRDISIHENLPREIIFRTLTFPIKMTGTLFLPRQTVLSIVNFITPIIFPVPPGGDSAERSQERLKFGYGPGNSFIIYIASLGILIFCLRLVILFVKKNRIQEAQTLTTGIGILIFGTLPLVAIIFSFPRWGYDTYFDSRLNYNPNVGAAVVFPFLLFGLAKYISKNLKIKKISLVASVLFIAWLANNMYELRLNFKQFAQNFGPDRRQVVDQLKDHLPSLPKKTVFYIETDGQSPYGPILPFNTSVPHALTVLYYDKNALPDSFFANELFDGRSQGYQYWEGRGFGYYTSKKELSQDLISNAFEVSDIYAFYYEAKKIHLSDVTSKIRAEMKDYLAETNVSEWELFEDNFSKIKFLYPPETTIEEQEKSKNITHPEFSAEIFIINVLPSFNMHDGTLLTLKEVVEKDIYFDNYHSNKATVTKEDIPQYFIRLNNVLIYTRIQNSSPEGLMIIEQILGSLESIDEKS